MMAIYTKLCKKMNINSTSQLFAVDNDYSEQILKLYQISPIQIKKFCFLVIYIYTILICLINLFINLELSIIVLLIFIGLYLYWFLLNILPKEIQSRENNYTPMYQILPLIINIYYLQLSISKDPNSYLFQIIEQNKNLLINYNEIQEKINNGQNFESCLRGLVFFSPVFTNFIRDLIDFNYDIHTLAYIRDIFSKQYDRFRLYSLTLEARLNILFFIAIFYPICSIFLILKMGLNFNSLFVIFFIFYILLSLIHNNLMKNPIHLLGAHLDEDSDGELIKFNTFIKFLQKISYYSINSPLESALISAFYDLSKNQLKILNIDNIDLNIQFHSMSNLIDILSIKMKSKQISTILRFILNIYEENSKQGQYFFSKLFDLLNFHMDIAKNQEMLIKSTRGKKKIYKFLLSFILGFLSVITYRILKLMTIYNNFFVENNPMNEISLNINYFIIISFIFLLITILSLNKIENSSKITKFDILIIISFFCSYFIAINVISSGF